MRLTVYPHHLQAWDEIIGHVRDVQTSDSYALVTIGRITVVLPLEMAEQLTFFMDRRVGILKTETDYRMRVMEER